MDTTKLNAKDLFQQYESLHDSIGIKVNDFKDEIGYRDAEREFTRKSTAANAYKAALEEESRKAYGDFLAVMGGHESLDGVNRIRKDPRKKNSWQVDMKLTNGAMLKALPKESELLDAVETKTTKKFSTSIVKQKLADGDLQYLQGHVTDRQGEILDDYIKVELKPDEFKEAKTHDRK